MAVYVLLSSGAVVPKYQEVRGQAGRLGEKRPIADHAECVKACLAVIGHQVQYWSRLNTLPLFRTLIYLTLVPLNHSVKMVMNNNSLGNFLMVVSVGLSVK